ncbi:two component transcriptional regulator, winged helix family [Syntrophobotulus glycolicus DSM 8271]|uniref:Stage 0 sporulation protein A homolog n=1 Tax=Syntrophobotulus glycolicus (strain DSM 8271 / FlGlyR) TaxID=645991 RepID=F0T2L0_SYNGF|nr:response regulator transcription factor [Syntrophobotulus glycolicus]ADY55328.1 two component transcriptional regulator, winged helix family [Syntrophobotulus glycolicus DSM 8271]
MRVLVIEDDPVLSATICRSLGGLFVYEQAFDGEEGLYLAEQEIYDVIVLDIMMPKMNGYQVLSALREKGVSTPVLLLTAKDNIDDKVKGFKLGADDYLVKPFYRQELLARLESLIRRSGGALKENILNFRDLTLNLSNRTVKIRDEELTLAGRQFDILEFLIRNHNSIVTKKQIFDRIWGFDSDTTITVVDVYTSNIRKALQKKGYDKYLKTVRGVGYMITGNGGGDE